MRILSIDLTNYVGIYNGTGKTEIRFDFSDAPIISIRGRNGSGKSTVLRALNPFPDDNREIIQGKDGRKRIAYFKDGREIIIDIIYKYNPKNGSYTRSMYIVDDGKDLNPTGNVSSAKEFIMDLFGIDNQFLYLTEISSEDRGLADKRPSERKRFISSLLDNLEAYNGFYKILSKKSSVYNTLIKSITSKMDRITAMVGDMGFDGTINRIQHDLDFQTKSYEDRLKKIGSLRSSIDKMDEIDGRLKEANAALGAIMKEIDIILNADILEYKNNPERRNLTEEDIKKDKEQTYQEFVKVSESLKIYTSNIRDINELLMKDKAYLDQFSIDANIEDTLNGYLKNIAHLEEMMHSITGSLTPVQKKYFGNKIPDARLLYQKLCDLLSEMKLYITFPSADLALKLSVNVEGERDSIAEKYDKAEKKLKDVESKYTLIKNIKKSNPLASSIIPKECTNRSCPFYALSNDEDINKISEEYGNISYLLDKYKEALEELDKLFKVQYYWHQICLSMSNSPECTQLLYESYGVFFGDLNNNPWYIETIIKYLKDICDTKSQYDMYSEYEKEYYKAKNSYEALMAKSSSYPLVKSRVEAYTEKLEDYKSKVQKLSKRKEELIIRNIKLDEMQVKLDAYNKTMEKKEALIAKGNELAEKVASIEKEKEALQNDKDKYDDLQSKIRFQKSLIDELNTSLNSVLHDKKLMIEYQREYDNLVKWYDKIETVKHYTSPTTGIQTMYMKAFMNNVIITANHLLECLFDGRFYLTEFIINENEFRIPCYGNGIVNDDISSMSTSQVCMLGMVISFAILYNSSRVYNIVKLDEIDGGLDTTNRSGFANVLMRLIDIMNCEQCFIISHNEEFTDVDYITME